MKNMLKKLRSAAGESIAETLIALLIAALALVMLAGALASAGNIVNKSNKAMNEYYQSSGESDGGWFDEVITKIT